ncbi:hypothetical protein EC973_002362 [Apophysomyces ossiformis]|uniref:Choline/ethanolaminephosphotransferase n=1 Tax=Apophysomyces ossiformis TaxID=679940 RepID=A0A8H7ENP6_9FUNG|nr:hypothetical protein EC973_002362 [Apophysomyces ossiformis]
MPYIPTESLPNLHRYKYGGIDKSLVSRHILTPYWNALVKIFPLWVAPNMITLLGLICILFNVATLFYYSTELGPCPNWVYYTFGIGLFTYQSLDAIDGKQARRTGASGPLGELFDHGCDALNTTLGCLTWASATYLGQSWWTVVSLFASLGNFYLSTWEEYHTGILYLGYFSGPVEGVLMLVAVQMISGLFGPAFWVLRLQEIAPLNWSYNSWTRTAGELQLNHILILIGAVVLAINIVAALINVISVKLQPTEYSHPDRSVAKALAGLFPFAFMSLLAYTWMRMWPSLVHKHLALFMPFLGLLFGHQVGLMIIAHVSKLDFPFWNNPVYLLLASGCSLAYMEPSLESVITLDHRAVARSFLFLAAAQYAHLALSVIQQICAYLDIGCLYIKKKKTEINK